jgi:hypothetical protein
VLANLVNSFVNTTFVVIRKNVSHATVEGLIFYPHGIESRHDNEKVTSGQIFDIKILIARLDVFMAVTMKNVVFWDIKTQFVLHRRHIKSPLQS